MNCRPLSEVLRPACCSARSSSGASRRSRSSVSARLDHEPRRDLAAAVDVEPHVDAAELRRIEPDLEAVAPGLGARRDLDRDPGDRHRGGSRAGGGGAGIGDAGRRLTIGSVLQTAELERSAGGLLVGAASPALRLTVRTAAMVVRRWRSAVAAARRAGLDLLGLPFRPGRLAVAIALPQHRRLAVRAGRGPAADAGRLRVAASAAAGCSRLWPVGGGRIAGRLGGRPWLSPGVAPVGSAQRGPHRRFLRGRRQRRSAPSVPASRLARPPVAESAAAAAVAGCGSPGCAGAPAVGVGRQQCASAASVFAVSSSPRPSPGWASASVAVDCSPLGRHPATVACCGSGVSPDGPAHRAYRATRGGGSRSASRRSAPRPLAAGAAATGRAPRSARGRAGLEQGGERARRRLGVGGRRASRLARLWIGGLTFDCDARHGQPLGTWIRFVALQAAGHAGLRKTFIVSMACRAAGRVRPASRPRHPLAGLAGKNCRARRLLAPSRTRAATRAVECL